jgi:hypothetical protein
MDTVYEKIEDRPVHMVLVNLHVESGCDPKEGEYSMSIASFLGCLDISSIGGVDDISLIKECIENDFDFDLLPAEGMANIYLEESGEWEGYAWHKYYKIQRHNIIEF